MKISSFQNFKNNIVEPFGLLIGNFDGVHLGHQDLISNFVSFCKSNQILPVIFTFKEHPHFYFEPEDKNFLIYTKEKNFKLLGEYGIEYIVELDFCVEFQKLSCKQFFEKYLYQLSSLNILYFGYDTHFGSDKKGYDSLEENNLPFRIERQKEPLRSIEIISSTLIRSKIKQGKLEDASQMLGRNYSIYGEVIKGKGIGGKKLYPTINMQVNPHLCYPAGGVYVSKTRIKKKEYISITNIGSNPTINSQKNLKIETYIIDKNIFEAVSYFEVYLFQKIREEKKFSSLDDLKTQIAKDILVVKDFYAKN